VRSPTPWHMDLKLNPGISDDKLVKQNSPPITAPVISLDFKPQTSNLKPQTLSCTPKFQHRRGPSSPFDSTSSPSNQRCCTNT